MPHQEKRKDKKGRWKPTGWWYGEVDMRLQGGDRPKKRFETKAEAEAFEAFVRTHGREPLGDGSSEAEGTTVLEAVKAYRVRHPMLRDKSGRCRMDVIAEMLGEVRVSGLTQEILEDFTDRLRARPGVGRGATLSDGSINRYLSALSSVIKWTRKRTRSGKDAIPHIELPWVKEAGKRVHWFTEEQEAKVCAYLASQDQHEEALSLRVLCATGMRWGEFAGLEPSQCQPEWIRLDETKTDTPRDVPIDPALSKELLSMVRTQTFPKYETMRKHLKRAVIMCGYSSQLGIHNARHSTATRLIHKDVALPIVQQFLGHKNIKTTMKYVHVQNQQLADASKKLYPHRGETPQNEPSGGVVIPFKSTG